MSSREKFNLFLLYELALNAASRSRAPLGRNFRTFGKGLFPAVLQPFRGKQKNNAVLETIALGIIALDSDNEAWYGNAEYDDARETFGIDENAHELDFLCHFIDCAFLNNAHKF